MARDQPYEEVLLCLTSTLHKLCRSFSDEQKSDLAHVVLDFITQIQAGQAAGESAAQCSTDLHASAETFLADAKASSTNAQDITCREGCAHCCKMAVAVATCEAEELIQVAQAKGLVLDQAKLVRQASYTDETWLAQPIEDRRCVFLGADDRCQVYEHRPFACRKYFSLAPPQLCDLTRYPKGDIPVWFDGWTEALATAAMTHFGSDFLPGALLAALHIQPKGNRS